MDTPTTLGRPIDLVRRWLHVMDTGDVDDVESIVAPSFLEHAVTPFGSEAPGEVPGPEHLVATVRWLRTQFPDLRMRADAVVAAEDRVAILVTSSGTNLGPLNGRIPPTGRPFVGQQGHWFRVSDGRLAEHWAVRDDLAVMLQLGLVPGPVAG